MIDGYDDSHTRTCRRPRKWTPEDNTCLPCPSSLNGRTRIQPSPPKALHLIVAMCYQHNSFLNQPRLRKQTSSNIPARILQQDMSNRKKSISVTSKLLSLILFSGLSRIIIFYSQFTKSKALNGSLPWSWIKAPKLYLRLDYGDPIKSARTKEIEYHVSSWDTDNTFTLWVIFFNVFSCFINVSS